MLHNDIFEITEIYSNTWCSLIVCEGISRQSASFRNSGQFPHYMRVYRLYSISIVPALGSLISYEGISQINAMAVLLTAFPHFM